VILSGAESVFALGAIFIFVGLLAVAFVYEWMRGGLDWR
jgi:NADH:ubiquinone oxidoreductase subunit 3 (subunit A)